MDAAAPSIGQAVLVEITDEDERTIYEGYVESAGPEGLSLSLSPMAHLHSVPGPSASVVVRWATQRGLNQFATSLKQARMGERLELLVEPPREIAVVQRRRFLRLPMRLAMTCMRLDDLEQPREKCIANTLELGGNGAGVVVDRALNVGEKVRFIAPLDEWGVCSGVAVVKRSHQELGPEGAEHRVALQFTHVDSKNQALVFSFLLAKQRARRASE